MKRILGFRIIIIAFLLLFTGSVTGQSSFADSLKREISRSANDTTRLILFGKTTDFYAETNPDSAFRYTNEMLKIARKLDLGLEEVAALNQMGYALLNMGNYPRALQTLLTSVSIAEDPNSENNILPSHYDPIDEFKNRTLTPRLQRQEMLGRTLQYLGILYANAGNHDKAKFYHKSAIPLAERVNNFRLLSITYTSLGRSYWSTRQTDSALISLQKAYDYAVKANYSRYLGSVLLNIGRAYATDGKPNLAEEYFRKSLQASKETRYYRGVVASYLALADLQKQSGNADSSLFYIRSGLPVAYNLDIPDLLLRSYTALANIYKNAGNNDSAVKYQSLIIRINDSLFNSKKVQEFQNIDFNEQQRQSDVEAAKTAYRTKLRMYILLAGIAIVLIIALILWRNSRQREKANKLLSKQKNELESALTRLKTAQSQLIQSEKMASLGELTAGIAHEIKNPLNFVNNFSEVNSELIDEMQEAISKGNMDVVSGIAENIKDNQGKITEHGKRADAIVKSMLQHSRSSTGKKEPTDINTLADEYLRLAYHGMRARDKSFNVTIQSDFDPTMGLIDLIPQDIGRVILNLITNAFYSVTEKSKQLGDGFEPTISVKTKKLPDKIEITVKDNGNGIPQKALDKIFQPFFTTKPTGQGTGLGLSLSYDIVKAHGGDIDVTTAENEGSSFKIRLPV